MCLLPSFDLERASIDEAFFDYTKAVKEILLQRYPYLAQVPEGSPDGVDTPLPHPPRIEWGKLGVGYAIPLNGTVSKEEPKSNPGEEQGEGSKGEVSENGEGGSLLDEENTEGEALPEPEDEQYTVTWHDVALSIAAELMDQARGKVREMGYTTSAVRILQSIFQLP